MFTVTANDIEDVKSQLLRRYELKEFASVNIKERNGKLIYDIVHDLNHLFSKDDKGSLKLTGVYSGIIDIISE